MVWARAPQGTPDGRTSVPSGRIEGTTGPDGCCARMAEEGAPFDTVRGLFQEGDPLISGSEIRLENHIQIVVRRPEVIIGLFRPRTFTAWAPTVASESDTRQAGVDG